MRPFSMYIMSTPFLFRQERCPKEADLRGAELIAPAIKAALLRIFRPALSTPLEHLNLKSVPSKNVPIFARQYGAVQNRLSFHRSSAWSGGRDTQGRALLARSAPLGRLLLVLFLPVKKSTYPHRIQNKTIFSLVIF